MSSKPKSPLSTDRLTHRQNSRRVMDDMYADMAPKQRRNFWRRAFDNIEKLLTSGVASDVKLAIDCFDKMAAIQERADKRQDPAKRLLSAIIHSGDAGATAKSVFEAALSEAIRQGDYKGASQIAKDYATTTGEVAPTKVELSTPAKAREVMRELFGGVTPKDPDADEAPSGS